jgi:hypothetical protein
LQRSIIAPAERVTNLRWGMVALVAAVAFVLSIEGIARVLRAPGDVDGHAFFAAAIVAQIPAGALLDRFGARRAGAWAAVLWGCSILATALGNVDVTVAASAGLGAAWSAVLPLAAKTTASWFPRRERSIATAIVALAATLPVLIPFVRIVPLLPPGTLVLAFGAAALLGAALLGFVYRDADDARVTYAERTYITDGGAQPVAFEPLTRTFAAIVRAPSVWGMAFAFGAFGYAEDVLAARAWTTAREALPLILIILASGAAADIAARRTTDAGASVKALFAAGMLVAVAALVAAGTHAIDDPTAVLIAGFGDALALPMIWSIPGRIAPRGGVGTVAAIMGLAGTLGALGGTFGIDLPGAAAAAVLSALFFAFGIRRIEPAPAAGISI